MNAPRQSCLYDMTLPGHVGLYRGQPVSAEPGDVLAPRFDMVHGRTCVFASPYEKLASAYALGLPMAVVHAFFSRTGALSVVAVFSDEAIESLPDKTGYILEVDPKGFKALCHQDPFGFKVPPAEWVHEQGATVRRAVAEITLSDLVKKGVHLFCGRPETIKYLSLPPENGVDCATAYMDSLFDKVSKGRLLWVNQMVAPR